MKKSAISAVALALALTGSALAADLPSYKAPPPPPPPPPPLWTGFYVGLNAGYAWSNDSLVNTAAFPIFRNAALGNSGPASLASALAANTSISVRNDGFIGGGQIGYNWQFGGAFVAGVEADIQGIAGGSNNGSVFTVGDAAGLPEAYFGVSQASKRLDYIGTVRGRLGWLFTPTLLVYGTGGLAYGGVNLTTSIVQALVPAAATRNPFFAGSTFSDTRVGWTAGGGVEWMFMPNWSTKVEYLYYDLGSVTTSSALFQVNNANTPFIGSALQTRTRYDGHIVRAGVNYHFNWGAPAPVLAKY